MFSRREAVLGVAGLGIAGLVPTSNPNPDEIDKEFIDFMVNDPKICYLALKGIGKRVKKFESVVAKHPHCSYEYAHLALKGPFVEGEDTIATDSWYSYLYALDVLNGPFPKGEDAIARDGWHSYCYAVNVLEGPFPKGEDAIATCPYQSYLYAKNVLKGAFLKGEEAIKNSIHALHYSKLVGESHGS